MGQHSREEPVLGLAENRGWRRGEASLAQGPGPRTQMSEGPCHPEVPPSPDRREVPPYLFNSIPFVI